MNTVEIIQEPSSATAEFFYRARCRDWQAVGATPGAALDAVERLAATNSGNGNGTVVIVQRFRPDAFFTGRQQARLQELMERFRAARAAEQELSLEESSELEALIEAEWQGAIARTNEIVNATKSTPA